MTPKATGRRRFMRVVAGTALACNSSGLRAQETTPINIGLTPVFLDDQITFLENWQKYLQQRLQRPIQFFQRGSYSEVLRLLQNARVDFAWLCGFPYWRNRDWLKLVAVPVYKGQPLYQAYLIRHVGATNVDKLADLKDKVFAYSDPDSNSGFLYPQYRLRRAGLDTRRFFARTFFTWSHRKVVEAVAVQLAHGGAVDGYVWDVLAQSHPHLTAQTTIFDRSTSFGFPPVVAAQHVDATLFNEFQSVLLGMSDDPEGQKLLQIIMLDGFIQAKAELFTSIGVMMAEQYHVTPE
ncbi:MAG: PhnD/SsuA/transferrin family substrate-binding protein [Thiothrix sp.]